jgi:cyclohexanone monooxygenase
MATSTLGSISSAAGGQSMEYDVIVVGAGFGGIYALYKMSQMGLRVKLFEKGGGVGGTWYWNRYPGARCDVPSLEYSYSFSEDLQQEWHWSELHATQPEIERYANHVVDRFALRPYIQFNSEVVKAEYHDARKKWSVSVAGGQKVVAKFLIMTTGGYHTPVKPDIPGIESFKGEVYYSNMYPLVEPKYDGKRIGLIGTGSSGHQITVALGRKPIKHLYIFQRTPAYIVPSHDRALTPEEVKDHKRDYAERRERARHTGYGIDVSSFPVGSGKTMDLSDEEFERRAEVMWEYGGGTAQTAFPDFVVDAAANKRLAAWLNKKIRGTVEDPNLADSLCSQSYYVGAKRIVIIDGYLETLRNPNVTLVDIKKSPITEITPTGVNTASGEYEVDMLILATGFDSATGSLLSIDIRGRDGKSLREKWAHGHRTYLGVGVDQFPNMFIVAQVGSPGIRSHVMVSIEQHVDWISGLIEYASQKGVEALEPTPQAEDAWTEHVAEVAAKTLLTVDDTQHLGSNVPGKPRVVTSYLGGVGPYRRICDEIAAHGYEGWVLKTTSGVIHNSRFWSGPRADIRWENRDDAMRDVPANRVAGFL